MIRTSHMSLPERLAFWNAHPLDETVLVRLPFDHRPFRMICRNDDTVIKTLYWDGFAAGWEPMSLRLWAERAQRARTVLDVGAYTGIYALLAISAGAHRVVAVEPNDENVARLRENVALNGWGQRVEVIHAAAAATEGFTTLFERYAAPNILSTVHSTRVHKGTPVQVPTVAIDMVASKVDLAKIDVEGAGDEVLSGMRRILGEDRPDVLMETTSEPAFRSASRSVGYSYRCHAIDERKGLDTMRLGVISRAWLRRQGNRNVLFSRSH